MLFIPLPLAVASSAVKSNLTGQLFRLIEKILTVYTP